MRPFTYERPTDAAGAVALLDDAGPAARYLGGGTNLVDLMKLLEASVKQATGSKTKEQPVSVADKKKAKDEAAAKKPAAKAKTKTADEDEAEARPTRRRKSA